VLRRQYSENSAHDAYLGVCQERRRLYVNLFVGSTITVENVGGTDVQMVQATDYPWKGKVAITVNPKSQKNFSSGFACRSQRE